MKCKSLRSWLGHLKDQNELVIVDRKVSLDYEIAGIAKKLNGQKAVYFSQVEDYEIPVVAGTAANRKQYADALGTSEEGLIDKFLEAIDNPLPCSEVSGEQAPVQEQVIHGEDVDLLKLFPIPVHHEKDSGNYISAGLAIVRDPETGKQNVSVHRLQISGKNRLGAYILPRHTFNFFKKMEEQGKPLEIAIVIGVDPVTMLASQAIAPLGQDEMEIAGALKGEPVPVVRCKTIDVMVPAHAEIVLEGKILPNIREPEGPFGEFPKLYGPKSDKEVVVIDCVTHRKDPIFQTILPASDEHLLVGGIPREASLLRSIRNTVPTVRGVHLTLGGTCRYQLVVSMKKRNEGEPKNVIFAAFAGHYDVKHVFVVDEEIDIFNAEEVEWAFATRFQAERDLVAVHGAQGSKLDPSTDDGVGSKLGFDCTVPLNSQPMEYERIRIPGLEQINIEDYILKVETSKENKNHFKEEVS
ncbi:UbiD family decarboxylase [Bacillus sp. Marseille-P3661]|uniref:UbiD family decarboxylase n=1 Tax=Bacillus sp. Marseille-P3661 TaxID=1936234 RepID=UPI000C82C3F5|nr:UbiD family decarboxylase [Bacillus sp. Marseille-P3661]